MKLSTSDWITLAEKIGAPIVLALIEARKHRRGQLAEISPEVADLTDAEFEATFGRFRQAADRLSDAGATLVEKGAAEKASGLEDDGA